MVQDQQPLVGHHHGDAVHMLYVGIELVLEGGVTRLVEFHEVLPHERRGGQVRLGGHGDGRV